MAFRARKVFGTFEKRAPSQYSGHLRWKLFCFQISEIRNTSRNIKLRKYSTTISQGYSLPVEIPREIRQTK